MSLVSVVVATYRREKELKNALESLANQQFDDFEIVLVDDNANDEWNQMVLDIVSEFRVAHKDVPLNYIVNKPNQGSAKTRNIGIEACVGEYITFLDDDDVYLPEKIQKQVAFMQNGEYDYSVTDLLLYTEDDKIIDRRVRKYIKDLSPQALQRYHLKYHITGTDTMMFKKDYIVSIGGFPGINVGDEFYLMQRAIEAGGKFGYLPGCDVKAYVHIGEGGLSSGDGKILGENALFEYKKSFFHELHSKDIRYVKMRHFAVLAFAELRRKKFIPFFINGIKAFFIAPIACLKLFAFER